jgi:hypothetical protein
MDGSLRYLFRVTILSAHVKSGRIVVDDPTDLPEGTAVEVALLDDENDLSPEERAELDASIDRGIAQAARAEGSSAEEVLHRLRTF